MLVLVYGLTATPGSAAASDSNMPIENCPGLPPGVE